MISRGDSKTLTTLCLTSLLFPPRLRVFRGQLNGVQGAFKDPPDYHRVNFQGIGRRGEAGHAGIYKDAQEPVLGFGVGGRNIGQGLV